MTPSLHEEIEAALAVLQQGGLLIYPTDTVWGLGCDATNEEAVAKIYALKQRDASKSMLVLLSNERMIHRVFPKVPEVAWQLLDFATKPTTLILDQPKSVASNLISTDQSLGFRWVKEGFSHQLLERFKKPIVSTSVNFSGQSTPSTFQEIDPKLLAAVDYVVHLHREKKCPPPSSIIKLTLDAQVTIIRR
ncbi:MAG: threonylcarbamoyl-AMP synthase [Flavobacterium sp. BFFFF2]|nr:MAG: threonylcarbamoyl-AMP synthase [Flavobacterium sp. BFFFF2]